MNNIQKISITLVLILTSYLLIITCRYWYADTLYTKSKSYNGINKPDVAVNYLNSAINLEPNQALYHGEIANTYTSLALAAYQNQNATAASELVNSAISESQKAISLSPASPNYKRVQFGIYVSLSSLNPNFLNFARDTLVDAIKTSPTDAKLYYNLGLTYARTRDLDKALDTLKKTIELKSNYKEARLAYAILLINKRQNTEAKVQLEYILKYIDPTDSLTRQTLESIK